MMDTTILQGDCREVLKTLDAESVQCVVTSPPYFGLRSYSGGEAEVGTEPTHAEYIASLIDVFRQVRRVLHSSGVVWLNLGDSFAGSGKGGQSSKVRHVKWHDYPEAAKGQLYGLKPKDLMGMPWRVALALQDDGWWLRCDVIWSKPSCLPESVTDRPTRNHEYVFLLAKSQTYYYDTLAIREEASASSLARIAQPNFPNQTGGPKDYAVTGINPNRSARKTLENFAENPGRNKRSVWEVNPQAYPDSHFAVMPEKLVEPCILAGSRIGDTVLDPFAGSGTVLRVATKHRRKSIGIELNPAYVELIEKRTSRVQQTLPMEDAS